MILKNEPFTVTTCSKMYCQRDSNNYQRNYQHSSCKEDVPPASVFSRLPESSHENVALQMIT